MLGFRRRRAGGRHSLGPAVTAIPSAPRRAEVPPARPVAPSPPPAEVPVAGRVELGFRDGTVTALDPDSEPARALRELAALLNARRERSGSSPAGFSPTPTG